MNSETADAFSHEPAMSGAVASSVSTAAVALATRAFLAVWHRLEIVGRDRLPDRGPFLMVSNHASHLDAVCLRAALPMHRLASAFTAVAEDYFYASAFRRITAQCLANAAPFSRRLHVRRSLRTCRSLLGGDDDNTVLVFFPEGTRSRDGSMGSFRPGVGALIAGSPWPVVPCGISGAFDCWPRGQTLPRPRSVRVTIGTPMRFDGVRRTRDAHRTVAQELRTAVAGLLCQ